MKKIGLICATLLVGLSLSACNNLASQESHKVSSSSSAKIVKHHKKHKKQHKQRQKSSSTSASSQQASSQSSVSQSTQQSQSANNGNQSYQSNDTNPASNQNYNSSELQKNGQAAKGSDGLMHGRIYGSNGYWIDADASRQGLADAGMPNSDQDIMNHAETGNAMWNASQNAGQ